MDIRPTQCSLSFSFSFRDLQLLLALFALFHSWVWPLVSLFSHFPFPDFHAQPTSRGCSRVYDLSSAGWCCAKAESMVPQRARCAVRFKATSRFFYCCPPTQCSGVRRWPQPGAAKVDSVQIQPLVSWCCYVPIKIHVSKAMARCQMPGNGKACFTKIYPQVGFVFWNCVLAVHDRLERPCWQPQFKGLMYISVMVTTVLLLLHILVCKTCYSRPWLVAFGNWAGQSPPCQFLFKLVRANTCPTVNHMRFFQWTYLLSTTDCHWSLNSSDNPWFGWWRVHVEVCSSWSPGMGAAGMVPMDVVTNQAGPSAEPEDGDGIMAFCLMHWHLINWWHVLCHWVNWRYLAGSGCRAWNVLGSMPLQKRNMWYWQEFNGSVPNGLAIQNTKTELLYFQAFKSMW